MRLQDFFEELKRRRVIRALLGWGVVSFAILQVIEPIMHGLHWPDAVLGYVVIAVALGFPLVMVFAWIFEATTAPRDKRAGFLVAGIGLLAALPALGWYLFVHRPAPAHQATPSIAVLPFADMSAQHDQEYFSDGIAEEILDALVKIDGLRVIGRTSSFSFKGHNEDLRAIAEKLGVGNLLEGSVRKAGSRIRITAQLIEAATGSHLWSETFDRDLTDVFAVQEEIARAVAQALEGKLLPGKAPHQTVDPEAYADYLVGRQLAKRGQLEAFEAAVKSLEKSTAKDPAYAPAWAALSVALFSVTDVGAYSLETHRALQQRALAAADRAVAAGPELADGYTARGWLRLRAQWDWAGAEADLKHAFALAPGNARIPLEYGALLATLGRFPEAIAMEERAVALDPLEVEAWSYLGSYCYAQGEKERARAAWARALTISPGHLFAVREMAFLLLLEGKPQAALELFRGTTPAWSMLSGEALAQHALGHRELSQAALDRLTSQLGDVAAIQIAEVHAYRGDRDAAFTWLDRALQSRDTGLARIKYRMLLVVLHADPRFDVFLGKLNLPKG